jgi:hypothetical protein
MPGFPLQLTEEEDKAILELAGRVGMKKRTWVMSLIRREIETLKEPEVKPVKTWAFRIRNAGVKTSSGVSKGDAWEKLGYNLGSDLELIEEHLEESAATAAGWFSKPTVVMDVETTVDVTDDDLPFGK